jgi:hypothetical protein
MVTFILAYVYIVYGFIYNVDVTFRYEMMVADYYIIIVALWSYAYMIIHMHIYAFHMKLMAGHPIMQ